MSEPPLLAPCSGAGACPGCGAVLPAANGPAHPYIRSSPACWARYGEVLAREFGDPEYFTLHQLTVDAYAVQHPGVEERRAIQSVGLHLMTLCMILEDGADPREGPKLHRRMVRRPSFEWLDPPPMDGRMTVANVLPAQSPSEHERLVRAWSGDAWQAWELHHETVRRWVRHSLG